VTSAAPKRNLGPVLVHQVLALPQLRSVILAGGHGGVDRVVEDVEVWSALDARSPIPERTATAVIMDGVGLRVDNYQVDIALRAAHESGASLFILCSPAASAPIAAARLANKLGLPFVVSPNLDVLALADTLRRFVRTPFILRADVLLDAVSRLRRTPITRGLTVVLENLSTILEAPTVLMGIDGMVVNGDPAAAPTDPRDLLEVPMVAGNRELVHVIQPITLAARERPTFWLVCLLHSPLPAWQALTTDILEVASWHIAVGLVADRLQRERDARFRLGVLNSIVAGHDRTEPGLVEQLGVLGWHVDGWCTALHIRASGDVDALRVLTLTPELQRHLERHELGGVLVERPDGWSMWLVSRKEPAPASYPDTTAAVRKAMESFTESVSRLALHVGIGRPYAGLHGLRTSLAESREASTIAQATGGAVVVRHVDDMGIRRLLLGWYASDTFADFAHTLLSPLLGLPNRVELIRTLEAYLDNQSSPTETAAALGIHRNTVLHRVARLRSLLSVDFDDPDERLAAQLACRLVKLHR